MTARAIENLEVWRAAQRMMQLHPQEPEFAACQLADMALEKGDMFGFELWQNVGKAAAKLDRNATGTKQDAA